MKTYLVSGSQGFIGSFLCSELLQNNCRVIGIDNYSKYGYVKRNHDNHPNFIFYNFDLAESKELENIISIYQVNQVVACAAMIGGISYFHEFPYDLLAKNERIAGNTFDACIKSDIERIVVLSSSMVYESATSFPVKEDDVSVIPPPISSYGFQKLAMEYYAKAAYDQYKLPYTIIRPFNCVGIGEDKAISSTVITSGNVELTLSHVLPDLIVKVLSGQDPLHILGSGNQVRCFTNGKDIARGIWLAMNSDKAVNETFNISISKSTTILELAGMVWKKIRNDEFRYVSDKAYKHDVQFRLPDTSKAKEVLGFEAEVDLDTSVDEVIEYIRSNAPLCPQTASS